MNKINKETSMKSSASVKKTKSKKPTTINGIVKDVFEILAKNPKGLTGGEVFMEYKKRHPATTRSRNEIAKRINDLRNMGSIKSSGTALCPFSEKNVTVWKTTGVKPERIKKTATNLEKETFNDLNVPIYSPVINEQQKTVLQEVVDFVKKLFL